MRLTHGVTRGADGRDACASKQRDRTDRRVDAVVMRSPWLELLGDISHELGISGWFARPDYTPRQ